MGKNLIGKSIIEERGRLIIPKEIRKVLNLKPGQQVIIENKNGLITIKPAIDIDQFRKELRGCIKKSRISPKDIKNIWHM